MTATPYIDELVEAYLEDCWARDLSPRTIEGKACYLRHFSTWAASIGCLRAGELSLTIVEQYRRYLRELGIFGAGLRLSKATRNNRLTAVRTLLRRMHQLGVLASNPADMLVLERDTRRLPEPALSAEEVGRLMALPNPSRPKGLRDRAILELFYASGIRCQEAVNLDLPHADLDIGELRIIAGKGNVDRVIPVSPRACRWLHRYLEESRPKLIRHSGCIALLIDDWGKRYSRKQLTWKVSRYRDRAGISKKGSTHLFRRTTATRMIENGADIAFVKDQLGHACISTTAQYIRLTTRRLRAEYMRTHPSAIRDED